MKRYHRADNRGRDGVGLNGLFDDVEDVEYHSDRRWEQNNVDRCRDVDNNEYRSDKMWDRGRYHGPGPSRNQDYGRTENFQDLHRNRGGNKWRGKRGHAHPPGLTGKEIGMFYKNRGMKAKAKMKFDLPTVNIGAHKERQISDMLGVKTNQTSCSDSPASRRGGDSITISDVKFRVNPLKTKVGEQSSPAIHPTTKAKDKDVICSSDGQSSSKEEVLVHEECKYKPATIFPQVTSPESKPSTSGDSFVFDDFIPLESQFTVKKEPGATCGSAVKGPPKRGKSKRGGTTTTVVDLTMEVTEQYSHMQDSHFKRKFLQSIMGNMESNIEEALARGPGLVRNPQLDDKLKVDLLYKKEKSQRYRSMLEFRKKLPAFQMRQKLLDMIEENQVIVVAGETGCGKTTQVAQFILDDYIMKDKGSLCHVVCTQPRRISATSVAQRIANERDEVLGAESIGYQIRLDRKIPRKQGSIIFCTTGVTLQWMLMNPGLKEVSHLILDEIHERDVTSDFVITLLKSVIIKRPDLKVILMSATLNAEQFSKYYGDCPFIEIPGFTFPVEEFYLEDVLQMTGFQIPPSKKPHLKVWQEHVKRFKQASKMDAEFNDYVLPYVRHLESTGKYSKSVIRNLMMPESEEINIELIAELIKKICALELQGAILVFMPGWDQIAKLHTHMEKSSFFNSPRFRIIPLHSLMPTAVQNSIFERPPNGIRKVVIATNIAETSITIDDVVFVINTGKTKMKNFDVEKNIATLKPEWVSHANAKQRRGRAGRTQAGVCYHLYTKGREMTFANYPIPEMLRTRLEQVILQIKILQIGFAAPFLKRVMDPPDPRAVDLSLKMLRTLNALDGNENLTPLGYHLAKLPMEPQTGKMILMAAIFSCVDPVLSVAAGLNFKDPFVLPLGKENEVHEKKLELSYGSKSDHLVLAEAMWHWEKARQKGNHWQFCREYFLSNNTLQLLSEMKSQLAGYLYEMNFLSSEDPTAPEANRNSRNVNLVKAIICSGLYPNVAHVRVKLRRNKPIVLLRTPEDGRVNFHIRSVNEKETSFESQFMMYYLKLKSSSIFLHDTTMIHPLPLLFFGENVDFRVVDGQELIYVSEHIFFKCQQSTANVVKLLRTKLDWILENKISHPGTIDWSDNSEEAVVLRGIIEVITAEHSQEVNTY